MVLKGRFGCHEKIYKKEVVIVSCDGFFETDYLQLEEAC